MILRLVELPSSLHGPDDPSYQGKVPKRARYMEPEAAAALLGLVYEAPWLIFTDIFRSPEASLAAKRAGRGAKPPGYSGHNFGLSFDIDVGPTLRAAPAGFKWYPELIDLLRKHGWYCHRRDMDPVGLESWHFNHLGDQPNKYLILADERHSTWDDPIEARIRDLYGADFVYDDAEVQRYLTKLGLYRGEIDGKLGPLTWEATRAFQRTWGLDEDGVAGTRTRRVLALVAADRDVKTVSGSAVVG